MTRLLTLASLIAVGTGCIIYDSGPDTVVVDRDPVINRAPWVDDAWAGCYYDRANADDIIDFQAWVSDADGVFDVTYVQADVYDARGNLVQSFELYPTDDPSLWFSDWLVSTTFIDCWYGGYTVDVTAYDSYDAYGYLTIYPETYVR